MLTSLRNAVLVSTIAAVVALTAVPAGAGSSGESDEKIAAAGVIVKRDLPRDFKSTAPESRTKQTDKVAATIPECANYLKVSKTNRKLPRAESRDFTRDDGDISNTSTVYKNTATAAATLTEMKVAGTAECLTQLFQKQYDQELAADPKTKSQVQGARVVIAPAAGLPAIGDDLVGYSGGVEITLTDGSVERILLSYLAVRVDRAITGYTVSSAFGPSGVNEAFANTVDVAIANTVERTQKALK